MKVDGKSFRTIWVPGGDLWTVQIIDQTRLPHDFVSIELQSVDDAARAISDMQVRGAPLIGATAAYGMALAMHDDASDDGVQNAYDTLLATRPTAVNLRWALDDMMALLLPLHLDERASKAVLRAAEIADQDVEMCSSLGDHGKAVIEKIWTDKGKPDRINVLTHCNAGWLATVDWGTALAPIYKAHDAGIPVHVWVDETRPRNQGAALTCWELGEHGVPHTLIVDNVGGHLMQHGQVDLCITGTDRTTAAGDVCNKIGTYLKALAASDNGVPFYVALPGPTIDWTIKDGIAGIPIEQRDAAEVTHLTGLSEDGAITTIAISPSSSPAANYAFDVTPARLVTGLITERGVVEASEAGLASLYPEHATDDQWDDEEEKRRYLRHELDGKVQIEIDGETIEAGSRNISSGGISINSTTTVSDDQVVQLHIDDVGDVEGRVARSFEDGFVVEFAAASMDGIQLEEKLKRMFPEPDPNSDSDFDTMAKKFKNVPEDGED